MSVHEASSILLQGMMALLGKPYQLPKYPGFSLSWCMFRFVLPYRSNRHESLPPRWGALLLFLYRLSPNHVLPRSIMSSTTCSKITAATHTWFSYNCKMASASTLVGIFGSGCGAVASAVTLLQLLESCTRCSVSAVAALSQL